MFGGHAQFDGNSAFSGGGFMPSQATQTAADPSFSPAKNRDSQPLTPLTVKQISEAFQSSDDKTNFLIDGVDVNNVELVGMMLNKTERVTDISFIIDDGTGFIDCYRWDGMYVIVHGHSKGFQGKKQMMVYSIRSLICPEPFAVKLIAFAMVMRGDETQTGCELIAYFITPTQKQQDNAPTSVHISNSGFNTPLKGYQASSTNHFSGQYCMDGLKGIDKSVLDHLQQPQCLTRKKGVHRNELVQQLNVPLEKILEAIESLESEGLVYSTIDECHYKSSAND